MSYNKIIVDLSEAVELFDINAAKKIYFDNFVELSGAVKDKDIRAMSAVADFLVSVKSFGKASLIWNEIYQRSRNGMRTHRLVKMIRCFYYAGKMQLARDVVAEAIGSRGCSSKEKAVLISVMAECGDNAYLHFLGEGVTAEVDDKFFIDRDALVSREGEFPMNKKALFVSGTPRSGTTSLGAFLNTGSLICMTTERYGPSNGYTKKMLDKKSIFHDKEYQKKYQSLYDKYDECTYIGDKRPNFLMSWELTKNSFLPSEVSIIHLLRDPYLVAESYFKRAKKSAEGKDFWSSKNISPRDQFVACWDYNINNKMLCKIAESSDYRDSFLVIDSENLYSQESNLLEIYDFLGLEINEKIRHEAKNQVEKSKALKSAQKVSNDTIDLVDKHLDFLAYEAAMGLRDI